MHSFDSDMNLAKNTDGAYDAVISEKWLINGSPNGGYLIALLAGAMDRVSEKKSTPVITANFISRCKPGPALIAVDRITQSSQFDRIQARIIQDGSEKVRACGTFIDPKNNGMDKRFESGPPELAPPDECFLIPSIPNYTLYDNMNILLDPCCAGWMKGNLADVSEHRGWISFKEKRGHDLMSVSLFADAFPPPVFVSQGPVAWVPTIEFSLNVRSIPADDGPLRAVFKTRFVSHGICEEDGELWDNNGELVAISRQISLFRKN